MVFGGTNIDRFSEGYSEGSYRGRKYGITKKTFCNGRSHKLYAKELGGNDFISMNFYRTTSKNLLKPCEMSDKKVLDFMEKVVLSTDGGMMDSRTHRSQND